MTTHDRDKIIAAAKEAGFPEWENTDDPEFLKVIEKLYVVAFQSGAASRDAEVAKWNTAYTGAAEAALRLSLERDQLRAHINDLREAMGLLEKYVAYNGDTWVQKEARNALSTTPEQSLAEYRNKVIEECAVLCDERAKKSYLSVEKSIANGIRAMKEQP